MKKETIKVVYASVHKIVNPRNAAIHERGIVLLVREHEGLHTSHKGYMWFDIATAIDLELIDKNLKDENDDKINNYLAENLIGQTITDKVYRHHTLGKNKNGLYHLKNEIAHLISAFETEWNSKGIIKVKHSAIRKAEKSNKENLKKHLLLKDNELEFEGDLTSGKDCHSIYFISGHLDHNFGFRVISSEKDLVIPPLLSETKPSNNPKAKEAKEIFSHYKMRIDKVLKEIIELS